MKTLIASLALVLSFSAAAAQKVSFTYFGNEGWGQTYYACDYAEARTEKVLAMFGATEVSVRCFGGIEFGRMEPVSITATFEAPVLMGNEMASVVKYKGDAFNPACGLNVAIVKNVLPKFSNVKVLKKSDSCAFDRSNFSYEFEIKK